jgi:beta-phosphoglucomutase-like phosphatase (HAD superfamily)
MIKNVDNSLKAVLFDLDGTLADSIVSLKKVYFEFLSSHNVVGSEEEFSELSGPSILEIVEKIRTRHNLTPTVDLLHESYMSRLESAYAQDVQPFQGADALLAWLYTCGIKLGLVTSAPTILVDEFLAANEWDYLFEIVSTGDSVEAAKPNPQIYTQTLEDLELPAERVIAVEDSKNGVQAAVDAGLRVIGISSHDHNNLEKAGAFKSVPNLSALRELLQSEQLV